MLGVRDGAGAGDVRCDLVGGERGRPSEQRWVSQERNFVFCHGKSMLPSVIFFLGATVAASPMLLSAHGVVTPFARVAVDESEFAGQAGRAAACGMWAVPAEMTGVTQDKARLLWPRPPFSGAPRAYCVDPWLDGPCAAS